MLARVLCAISLSGLAAAGPPPAWWKSLHGAYLEAQELAQVTFPQPQPADVPAVAQSVAPIIESAVASVSKITYLPQYVINAGGGVTVPGNGRFAFWSASTYLGQQTYATAATEYTVSHGAVSSCALAGLSKVLYQFGSLSIGITGLGGGCNSTEGTSQAAASGQAFASVRLGKTPWSIVLTGMKTSGSAVKMTLSPQRASE